MKDSLVYLVQQLLQQNGIGFDKEELAFQIESHPSYPSLHAITGVLDHFNIENIALDVPVNEDILRQLPKSFLAQIDINGQKEFATVKNKGLGYEIFYSPRKKGTLKIIELIEKFTGILVAVGKGEELQEDKNSSNTIAKSSGVACILFFTALFALYPSVEAIVFFAVSLLGIYISYAIFKQEQGGESYLANAFCSGESEKKDCNAVLTSKGAKVFNNFTLSDLSLSYFIGMSLSVYFLSILGANLSLPFLISMLAVPITVYSVYYQYIVIKKWCLLCLSIVGVLWIQAFFALVNINKLNLVLSKDILVVGFSFSLALVIWQFMSSFSRVKKEFRKTKVKYFKFKKNVELFNALLGKSKRIYTELEIPEIVVGNKDADLKITAITNPFCGHCREVHALMEDIDKKYGKKVQWCIRFNINTVNPNSDVVKIASRLLELFDEDTTRCMHAMNAIYNGENSENWLKKWGDCYASSHYIDILKRESDWCKNNNINFTPEILINGRPFPKEYDRRDLIYFIEDLTEQTEIESNCPKEYEVVN